LSRGPLSGAGAVGAAAQSAGRGVPRARGGGRAVLGGSTRRRHGVLPGGRGPGARRRRSQAIGLVVPPRQALHGVAAGQAPAGGDLLKARYFFVLKSRAPGRNAKSPPQKLTPRPC